MFNNYCSLHSINLRYLGVEVQFKYFKYFEVFLRSNRNRIMVQNKQYIEKTLIVPNITMLPERYS